LKEHPEVIRVIDGEHHKANSYRFTSEISRKKIRIHSSRKEALNWKETKDTKTYHWEQSIISQFDMGYLQ
jgi:hypothetical protein